MSEEQMTGPPILNPEKAVLKETLAREMVSYADRPMMSQAQYVASLFLPGAVAYLQFFTDLAIILLGWLSVSVEVFLRREFGERYLSNIRLTLGFIMLVFVGFSGFIFGLIGRSNRNTQSTSGGWGGWVFTLFFIAFLVLSAMHRWRIRSRNRKGIEWHSLSFGISWLSGVAPWGDWTLYTVVEPLVVLVLGIVFGLLGFTATTLWLLMSAIALFIKNQMIYMQHRDRILDLMDNRIEARNFQPSLQGAPKQKTAGFSVVPFPPAQVKVIEEIIPDFAATMKATLGASVPGVGTPMTVSPFVALGDFAGTVQGTMGGDATSGAGEKKEAA